MTGQQQRQHLVAHLARRHPLAGLLVDRVEQHREQVLVAKRRVAALLDYLAHHLVERSYGGAKAPLARRRNHPEHVEQAEFAQLAIDFGQRHANRLGIVAHVGAEQRLGHDRERKPRHLGRDVERLAALRQRVPSLEHLERAVDHQVAESGDALAMEHRRHQPALAMPERAVAGQQAVAEQAAQHRVVDVVLVVVAMVVVQDVADVVGMREEQCARGAEAKAHDVAVVAKAVAQKSERVALYLAQAAEQQMPARSGWSGATRQDFP